MTGGISPSGRYRQPEHRQETTNLADILERVLDKGIVIAGDIKVNLLDIELLTIKIRLLVASVDKAKEMGIDWWEHDRSLSSGRPDLALENQRLRERIEALESGHGQEGRGQEGRGLGNGRADDRVIEPAEDGADDRPRRTEYDR